MALIGLPLTVFALFPYWYGSLNPELYSSVRCVRQTADGELGQSKWC